MGVKSLSSFMKDNGNFAKIKLKNTQLIIDGNNLSHHLYSYTKRSTAFGGDYDDFYAVVIDFLANLKKCNIKPIIIMDGGTEEKKLATKDQRREQRFKVINKFSMGYQEAMVTPMFHVEVFIAAVKDMNVYIHCTKFEADREIALLAKSTNCPVLSDDSDFYCFNVKFIPLFNFSISAKMINGEFHMPCSMFILENFLKQFPGLTYKHIPIMATVLGNDFVSPTLFEKVFENIGWCPSNITNNFSFNVRKIIALLNWLKKSTPENAMKQIKNFLPKSKGAKVESAFNDTFTLYDLNIPVPVPYAIKADTPEKKEIFKKVESCELPSFIIDMETLNICRLALQIEDHQRKSTHLLSLLITAEIYGCLQPKRPLEIEVNLSKELLYPTNKGMLDVLHITDSELGVAKKFPDWELFILSLIYCSKNLSLSSAYWHAILLTFTINSIAYQLKNFWKGQFNENEVKELINFAKPYRGTMHMNTYDVSIVHTLNTFQSVLYSLNVLSKISNSPYQAVNVSQLYSGTLAYNLYHLFRDKPSIGEYLKTWLTIPNICKAYLKFSENFEKFWLVASLTQVQSSADSKKKRRRRKKGKIGPSQDVLDISTLSI